MRKILLIIFGIFLINLVSSIPICIDHDPPSPPSNLILTKSVGNIIITWEPATDTPNCSGISHYDIYKNSAFLISVNETNYLDIGLSGGTYIYTVYAFDLAGHNEGVGISKTITLGGDEGSNDGSPRGGSGGSGSDYVSYWQCREWGECINGTQIRICEDVDADLPNRIETKICFPNFIPLDYKNKNDIQELNLNEQEEQKNLDSGITGAIIGLGKSGLGIGLIFAIIIIVIAIIIMAFRKSPGRSPQSAKKQLPKPSEPKETPETTKK